MSVVPRVGSVMVDCGDAKALAEFWSALLDVEVAAEHAGFIWLKPQREGGFAIAFQEVPDPTPGKNRLHLDLGHEDLDAVDERVADLGGRRVEEHTVPGFVWRIYEDPEANVFCVAREA